MHRQRIITTVGLLLRVVSYTPLAAQEMPRRHGFWISGGLGGGVNTASIAETERRGGAAGFIRAGGAPSAHVVLGTELIGWVTERDSVTTSRGNVTVFVQYYPSATGGLFLKGGIGGAGFAEATPLDPGTLVTDSGGFGLTLGGGYEFPVSRIVSLTANVDWVFQSLDDKDVGPATSSLFLLTVGITFPGIG